MAEPQTENGKPSCSEGGALWMTVVVTILLFFLTAGLAGSVDVRTLRSQLNRRAGISCGLLCQFLLMPFIGFSVVMAARPQQHVGLTLLILCSSSGGAYSNWWCSLFNADLALSVAMTAVSTLVSAFMLPLNLTIYLSIMGHADEVGIPWGPLLQSIASVVVAIVAGVFVSTCWPRTAKWMTAVGNFSGVCMIVITAVASVMKKKDNHGPEEEVTPLWGHDWSFYLTVMAPFVIALLVSLGISSLRCIGLKKPERTAIVVEVSYQNQGIASAVAISAFCGNAKLRADAAAVPIIYGLVESIALAIFCLIMWKLGWSYAPPQESLCTAIRGDFQPRSGVASASAEDVTTMEAAEAVEAPVPEGKVEEAAPVAEAADLETGKGNIGDTLRAVDSLDTEAPPKGEASGIITELSTSALTAPSPPDTTPRFLMEGECDAEQTSALYEGFLPGTSVGHAEDEDDESLSLAHVVLAGNSNTSIASCFNAGRCCELTR